MIRVDIDSSAESLECRLNEIENQSGTIMQVIVHSNHHGAPRYTTIWRERVRRLDDD